MSALLRGRLDRFSIERLVRALRDLGQDVQLTLASTAKRNGRGRLIARIDPKITRDGAGSRVSIVGRKSG